MPILKRKAIIHGHCRQKAIMKINCEEILQMALHGSSDEAAVNYPEKIYRCYEIELAQTVR